MLMALINSDVYIVVAVPYVFPFIELLHIRGLWATALSSTTEV